MKLAKEQLNVLSVFVVLNLPVITIPVTSTGKFYASRTLVWQMYYKYCSYAVRYVNICSMLHCSQRCIGTE